MLLLPYMPMVYVAMAFNILSKALLVVWALKPVKQLWKLGLRQRHSSLQVQSRTMQNMSIKATHSSQSYRCTQYAIPDLTHNTVSVTIVCTIAVKLWHSVSVFSIHLSVTLSFRKVQMNLVSNSNTCLHKWIWVTLNKAMRTYKHEKISQH